MNFCHCVRTARYSTAEKKHRELMQNRNSVLREHQQQLRHELGQNTVIAAKYRFETRLLMCGL